MTEEFKFNFFSSEPSPSTRCNTETSLPSIPAQRIDIQVPYSLPPFEHVPELPGILKTLPQSIAVPEDTDVIPGVYEGGLKTWECSIDLALYLQSHTWEGVSEVLELGCGSALPSIALSLARNDLRLTLQDYNDHVLQSITAPNLQLNQIPLEHCQFYCGDWSGLTALLRAGRFQLILTSETIYRPQAYPALLAVFKHSLAPEGRVLLAAKDYYFGLGGSVEEFSAAARAAGFTVQRVWTHLDGVPRSILQLTK